MEKESKRKVSRQRKEERKKEKRNISIFTVSSIPTSSPTLQTIKRIIFLKKQEQQKTTLLFIPYAQSSTTIDDCSKCKEKDEKDLYSFVRFVKNRFLFPLKRCRKNIAVFKGWEETMMIRPNNSCCASSILFNLVPFPPNHSSTLHKNLCRSFIILLISSLLFAIFPLSDASVGYWH